MTTADQWYQEPPSGTLDRVLPSTAARLRDLGQACNTMSIANSRARVEVEAAQMMLSRIVDVDDIVEAHPYLHQAEDAVSLGALRTAAFLTATYTRLAITFAVHAQDALDHLLRNDPADSSEPVSPAPSDFLREPTTFLPAIADWAIHRHDADRDDLSAAHRRLLEAVDSCRDDGVDQFDEPSAAAPGLTDALAAAAHGYAARLVDACLTVPA